MPEVAPARAAALRALTAWRGRLEAHAGPGGGRAEDILAETFESMALDRRDRALAHEIFYGTIRNLIAIDHILKHFIKRRPGDVDPLLRDVLRTAVYQLRFLDRVPDHAAVNDAVEQAKSERGQGAASFVNGVLRGMLRRGLEVEYPDASSDPAGRLSLVHSYPLWLAKRWVKRLGAEEAGRLMAAGNEVPPLTLRVNTLKADRAGLAESIRRLGLDVSETTFSPDGLVVGSGASVQELPGYAEGLFYVQDEAAQLVCLLLGAGPGERILDACAAPGGKAAHIYALSGGEAIVLAADIGLDKSRLMKENINRLGAYGVHVAVMDSSAALPVRGMFDRVLLDAPCSALGVIRRRPEVKYIRREKDMARLAALQSAMLENVSKTLAPGGTLVYSTCTTEPEEGERIIEGFIGSNPGFFVQDAGGFLPAGAASMVKDNGFMRSYPHTHGTDGFFAARLRRKD